MKQEIDVKFSLLKNSAYFGITIFLLFSLGWYLYTQTNYTYLGAVISLISGFLVPLYFFYCSYVVFKNKLIFEKGEFRKTIYISSFIFLFGKNIIGLILFVINFLIGFLIHVGINKRSKNFRKNLSRRIALYIFLFGILFIFAIVRGLILTLS
jgi:hypothetical protein